MKSRLSKEALTKLMGKAVNISRKCIKPVFIAFNVLQCVFLKKTDEKKATSYKLNADRENKMLLKIP